MHNPATLALLLLFLPAPAFAQVGVLERIETKIDEILKKVGAAPVDPPPAAGPTISNVVVTAAGPTGATISWSLSEVGTGQVEYGPTASYGFLSTMETKLIFSAHKQELSNLKPATLYHFRIWSTNKAGRLSVSEDFTFTTQGKDPPPAPSVDLLPGTIFVATSGSDSNPGTKAQPLRTIQKAANVAKPGDVVSAAAGVYNERVNLPTSGVAGKLITFQGEPGAVIDGGAVTTGWTASCPGAYFKPTSSFGFDPHHASWDDRQIVWINKSMMDATGTTEFCRADGPRWDGVIAVAGNFNGQTHIRYRDGRDPNKSVIRISPMNAGVFNLGKQSFIKLTGFTVKNGYYGVDILGSNNIVEHNSLVQGAYIVRLAGGASSNIVRKNSISQNYIYADYGHPRSRSPADYQALDANRVWGDLWGVGVWITGAGQNNDILDNDFSRIMAGIWIAGGPDPLMNANTVIANNRFKNCADYCVLPHQGSMANLQIRDNTFHEYHSAIRWGPVWHGPVYFTGNKFSGDTPTLLGSDVNFSLFDSVFPEGHFTDNSFVNLDIEPIWVPRSTIWTNNTCKGIKCEMKGSY